MKALDASAAATPFDQEAFRYDEVFDDNLVTRSIRPIVWGSLLHRFKPGDHILELNCGTGTDAVMLAEHGIRVTAIDASGAMIVQAQNKIAQQSLNSSITVRQLSFDKLRCLSGQKFDGAFSNFGGLNCATDLPTVFRSLTQFVRPGGYLILCLMNKFSLWEMASYMLRGRFRSSIRRFRPDGMHATIGTSTIKVWYYRPAKIRRMLLPWFVVRRTYGLNIFSPTPNSRSFVKRYPKLTPRLLSLDNPIRGRFPFHSMGDHFVIEAERLAE